MLFAPEYKVWNGTTSARKPLTSHPSPFCSPSLRPAVLRQQQLPQPVGEIQ